MKRRFNRIVDRVIHVVGTPSALLAAAFVIVVWALTGPIFGFSDTWQLVINTSTTIVTFLMVFVIQNAQNRDAKAVHIKLDELIEAIEGARNKVVLAENLTEEEQELEIQKLIKSARRRPGKGGTVHVVAEFAEEEAEEAEATAKVSEREAARARRTAKGAERAAARRSTSSRQQAGSTPSGRSG